MATQTPPVDKSAIAGILEAHPKGDATHLILALQDIQHAFNYIPREGLVMAGMRFGVPLARVHSVATFYKAFSLTPRGRNILCVCTGTACHIRGATMLVDEIGRRLGIRPGETTPDLEYTLETVNCVGACAMAPLLIVNKTYHGKARAARIEKILTKAAGGETRED